MKRSTFPQTATLQISSAANWAGGRLAPNSTGSNSEIFSAFNLVHFVFGRVYGFFSNIFFSRKSGLDKENKEMLNSPFIFCVEKNVSSKYFNIQNNSF